jgi:DNA primase large subunit
MIAEAFNDEEQINLYLIYCKKYPDEIIQRAFAAARDFPEEKIRKSRAAIFFYLIKRYTHEDRANFSH